MLDSGTTIESLKEAARTFAQERQWESFHTPKNLSMALATEAGELMEHFLWLDGEESRALCIGGEKKTAIADELADVMYLICQFSIQSGIDISEAFRAKMIKNAAKYPVTNR